MAVAAPRLRKKANASRFRPSLAALVNRETMLTISRSMFKATGMVVSFNDQDGRSIVEHEAYHPFCRLVCSTTLGRERCRLSNLDVGTDSARRHGSNLRPCHAGIPLLSVPIIGSQHHLGSIVFGQVLLQKPTEDVVRTMLRGTSDLGHRNEDLADLYVTVPVVEADRYHSAAHLVAFVAQSFAEMTLNRELRTKIREERERRLEAARIRSELEASLRRAELHSLADKIKPHFLFNTLNVIARLIMMDRAQEAADVVYSLSRLLRLSLEQADDNSTLEDELAYVESYLTIQKKRFGARLRYVIDIPADLNSTCLPALTLQPLVENALTHGLEPLPQGGSLCITATELRADVLLTVSDDGAGISHREVRAFEDWKSNNKPSLADDTEGSLGLRITHRRLDLRFGKGYGLTVAKRVGGGTSVTMTVPGTRPR